MKGALACFHRNNMHPLMPNQPDLQDQHYPRAYDRYDDEISLLDLAITIAKHKKLIIGLPLLVGVVSAVALLFMPRSYTATARILPRKLSSEVAISLLQSQPMADSLISRFRLVEYYESSSISAARKSLAGASSISSDRKNPIIAIEVDAGDPARAAELANAYADNLGRLAREMTLTRASEQRMLLERQLPDAEEGLRNAERALQESGGAAQVPDARTDALLDAASDIKARIAMKELEIVAIGSLDPAKNPNFVLPQQQLQTLWDELGHVESTFPAAMRLPAVESAYLRRLAAYKYAEARLELLQKQIELARVEEAREAPSVEMLDRAYPPEHASKPQRTKVVLIAILAAGFLAVLWAFIAEALGNAAQDSEQQPKLRQLKESLRWG